MQTDEKEPMFLCMGSACHRIGVYQILPKLQSLIEEFKLTDRVVLKGHFCLNNCSEGVIVKVRDRMFERIKPDNVEEMFYREILPYLSELAS